MKDPIISYRGATARLSEVSGKRVDQIQQQQATRLVSYRGARGVAALGTHAKRDCIITYRGATAKLSV